MVNTKEFFLSTTQRLFSNWSGLKLAVENGMGTREDAVEFCQYMVGVMYMNEKLDCSDIVMELEDYMDNYFDTELQDNSAKEIAQELLRFHQYYVEGNESLATLELEKLPPIQPWIISYIPVKRNKNINNTMLETNGNDSDSSSSGEDSMEVEEEWTEVKGRHRRGCGK